MTILLMGVYSVSGSGHRGRLVILVEWVKKGESINVIINFISQSLIMVLTVLWMSFKLNVEMTYSFQEFIHLLVQKG